jgi:replicative DNA helicase
MSDDAMVPESSPHDNAAEACVLGAMMIDHRVIDDVATVLAGPDFYRPVHERIFDAILEIHHRRERPDPVTVAAIVGSDLAQMGGPVYLHTLTSNTPFAAAGPRYAEQVASHALRRALIGASMEIRHQAESDLPAATAAENARKVLEEATSATRRTGTGIDAAELMAETLDALERGEDPGVETGWPDLDDKVNGLRPGQLCVIGARPGVGKSVIASNLMVSACKAGVGVHLASLEMTRREVMNRMLSAVATVNLALLMNHRLSESDWSRIGDKAMTIQGWPFHVDDTPSQTIQQIRSRARTTAQRKPLGLVIVDYLQLMAPRDRKVPREQQVGELSEGLKALAKELSVPVVALAQVNRGPMDRHDKRPAMSDLRESGRIEADADHVWLLHREDLISGTTTGVMQVLVAKNRNGVAGSTVDLQFQGHYSRAVSSSRWSPTDVVA